LENLKIRNFAEIFKNVSNVSLYHLYDRYLSNIMKISAKINTMQNINILFFVHSPFLTSLTFEVKQGRPTDHQASAQ